MSRQFQDLLCRMWRVFSRMRRPQVACRRRTVHLRVEPLEWRQLLSTFSVITNADSGTGSLRQAIESANTNPGKDSIAFAIPGSGVHTIQVASPLPEVTDSVSIDGFTEAGSHPNTSGPGQANNALYTIVIDGSQLTGYGSPSALTVSAGNSTIRGLKVQGFRGVNFVLKTNGGNIIAGNYGAIAVSSGDGNMIGGLNPADQSAAGQIGLSSNNNVVQGNLTNGVFVTGSNNRIGGTTAAARNVISGNSKYGIEIYGTNNTVQGNYIGTDVTGITSVSNRTAGIIIRGNGNTIGGTTTGARNVISGNSRGVYIYGGLQNIVQGNWIGLNAAGGVLGNSLEGILITSNGANNLIGGTVAGAGNVISGNRSGVTLFLGATGNVIQGNKIGTLSNGTSAAGNIYNGVVVSSDASKNTIGGTAAGAGNIIAFTKGISGYADSGHGVFVQTNSGANIFPIQNAILGNAIFSNAGLGIELQTGGNQNQAAPVIQSVTTTGSTTTIKGTFASTPNSTFRLEFFSNTALDPSGFGEGQKFVVAATIRTAISNGQALFTVSVPAIASNLYITATATSSLNNTSEFSNGVKVVASATASTIQSQAASSPSTSSSSTDSPANEQTIFRPNYDPSSIARRRYEPRSLGALYDEALLSLLGEDQSTS